MGKLCTFLRQFLHFLTQERQQEVLAELSLAARPGFDYFLLVVLSCIIATLGLITDSAAVIIGAMLVAPLMSPILGLSLASVAGEQRMFRQSVIALAEGVLLALMLSMLIGWIARLLPFGMLNILPGEILARTHPSPPTPRLPSLQPQFWRASFLQAARKFTCAIRRAARSSAVCQKAGKCLFFTDASGSMGRNGSKSKPWMGKLAGC